MTARRQFDAARTVEECLDDPGTTLDPRPLRDICKRIVALEQPDPDRHQINALADAIKRNPE